MHRHAARRPGGRPSVADLLCQHADAARAAGGLSGEQLRVLAAVEACRTPALGCQLYECGQCRRRTLAFLSCRDRHCPRCQRRARDQWAARRLRRLLPVPHFQVVFTLPAELRGLARARPRLVYDTLFAAASRTLTDLGRSRMNARLAVTMVLHTWTREMTYHPHVHAIVSAGGLRRDDTAWVPSSRRYLFPVRVLRRLFRAHTLRLLEAAWRRGDFRVEGQRDGVFDVAAERAFARLVWAPKGKKWVVHVDPPKERQAKAMVLYLARYVYQVAIADQRIVTATPDAITFRTRDREQRSLDPVRFVRRYLDHVLPTRLRKVRHYGLYAPAAVNGRLELARCLAAPHSAEVEVAAEAPDGVGEADGSDVADPRPCPHCGTSMACLGIVSAADIRRVLPKARGPPSTSMRAT